MCSDHNESDTCRSLRFGCSMHGIFAANDSSAASSITPTKNRPPDFSMDVRPFAGEVGPVLAVAMSPTIIGFYGLVFVAIALAVILPR
jgi:hypothetical protein